MEDQRLNSKEIKGLETEKEDSKEVGVSLDPELAAMSVDLVVEGIHAATLTAKEKAYDFAEFDRDIYKEAGKDLMLKLAPYIEQAWKINEELYPAGTISPVGDVKSLVEEFETRVEKLSPEEIQELEDEAEKIREVGMGGVSSRMKQMMAHWKEYYPGMYWSHRRAGQLENLALVMEYRYLMAVKEAIGRGLSRDHAAREYQDMLMMDLPEEPEEDEEEEDFY